MKMGKVIVITNDSIDCPIYDEIVFDNHLNYLKDFVNEHGIDAKLESSQDGFCEMARLGHLVAKVERGADVFAAYLPEVITDRQKDWFFNNYQYENHMVEGAYSLIDDQFVVINGKNNILKEVERKNNLYERGNNNVR